MYKMNWKYTNLGRNFRNYLFRSLCHTRKFHCCKLRIVHIRLDRLLEDVTNEIELKVTTFLRVCVWGGGQSEYACTIALSFRYDFR